MKKLNFGKLVAILFAAFLCFCAVTLPGCTSTTQRVSYKATSASATVVDTAMKVWGDYVAYQKAKGTPVPLSQEVQVKQAYQKYVTALNGVTKAGYTLALSMIATNSPEYSSAQQAVNTATAVMAATISDLISLLNQFGVKVK